MKRRPTNHQITLKPQDLLVLLKLCILSQAEQPSYRQLASMVGLTKSEVGAVVRRLQSATLLREVQGSLRPIREAAREFVVHGAPYSFPPIRGEITRGIATGWGAPVLRPHFVGDSGDGPVWPHPKGDARGPALYPLYPSVPEVALLDAELYELLALFDALRDGRARERKLAESMLLERLQ